MGTIRYTPADADGHALELSDHEGYIAQVFDDGTLHGGGSIGVVDRRTAAFRAACDCGWLGATTVPRAPGESAWRDFDDLPVLDAEWTAHTDPLLAALAAGSNLAAENEPDRPTVEAVARSVGYCTWLVDQLDPIDLADDDRFDDVLAHAAALLARLVEARAERRRSGR